MNHFRIVSALSRGRRLTLSGRGGELTIREEARDLDQWWELRFIESVFRNRPVRGTALVLADTNLAIPDERSSPIRLRPMAPYGSREFMLDIEWVSATSNHFRIVRRSQESLLREAVCLDVFNERAEDGAPIHWYPRTQGDAPNQLWWLNRMDEANRGTR